MKQEIKAQKLFLVLIFFFYHIYSFHQLVGHIDSIRIQNYKISNNNHIWNLVKIGDSWLHLDLTWDDPVTNTGENLLLHKFFLIDTDTLLKLDPNGHNFNKDYYPEISH